MGNRNYLRKQKKRKDSFEQANRDWAELPRPILESVFDRTSLVDCISISKVCKSWRDVFSPDLSCWAELGYPTLFMSGQKDRVKRTCVGFSEKRAWEMNIPEALGKYCWGSVRDWLILVDHIEHFLIDITLLNPFTGCKIELPQTWDFYHKIVLSGVPSNEKSLICMLVSSQSREVQFWVAGAGDGASWRSLKLEGEPFEDAVFSNGRFFLLAKDNHVLQIETADILGSVDSEVIVRSDKLLVSGIDSNNVDDNGGALRYLVESRGEVLLICRYFNNAPEVMLETRNFKVFSLNVGGDEVEMSWKRVENLGDRVLFLEKCSSMSFSARKLGGTMVANSIYFSNDYPTPWSNEWQSCHLKGMSLRFGLKNSGRKHWGIFRLGFDDNDDDRFRFLGERDSSGPVWFTAPLWWYCKNFSTGR